MNGKISRNILGTAMALAVAAVISVPAEINVSAENNSSRSESGSVSYYTERRCHYEDGCIFDISCGVSGKETDKLNCKRLTLSDKTVAEVYYPLSMEKYMEESGTVNSLKTVLKRNDIRKCALRNVKKTGSASPDELAELFYKNDDIAYFAAVCPHADSKTVESILSKAYADDEAAFFAGCLEYCDSKTAQRYASKAYADDKAGLFSLCLERCGSSGVAKRYAAKAYADSEPGMFSICINHVGEHCTAAQYDDYLCSCADQAYADGNEMFCRILQDEMSSGCRRQWNSRRSSGSGHHGSGHHGSGHHGKYYVYDEEDDD